MGSQGRETRDVARRDPPRASENLANDIYRILHDFKHTYSTVILTSYCHSCDCDQLFHSKQNHCLITYVHFCTVARGMKQRRKRIPSFTVMASIIAKRYFHTSSSPRKDRAERDNDTDGLLRESEAIGPSTHGLTLLTRYVTASHP